MKRFTYLLAAVAGLTLLSWGAHPTFQPARGLAGDSAGGNVPEWYGRFATVKEWVGTFTLSLDYSATQAPDPDNDIFNCSVRWSVAGTMRLKQMPDLPNSWIGDGDAAMTVSSAARWGKSRVNVVYDGSTQGSGRTKLAGALLQPRVGIVSDANYWIHFGEPTVPVDDVLHRLDTGRTDSGRTTASLLAQAGENRLPRTGQRLQGSKEVATQGNDIAESFTLHVPEQRSWAMLWPQDRPAKGRVNWDLVPVVEDLDLVVELKDYADWFPRAGRDERTPGEVDLPVRVQVLKRDGSRPTDAIVKKFTFEIVDVSSEPGVAMNYPPRDRAARDPDLQFDKHRNFLKLNVVDARGQKGEVEGSMTNAEAVISSYDWGAYGAIKVTAELHDGRTLFGHLKGESDRIHIPVPKRRDGSKVADYARAPQRMDAGSLADHDDSESDPVGDARFKGDGLTFYEEYRGFYVNGEHIRGSAKQKDFFVRSEIGQVTEPGIMTFAAATGLRVHYKLEADEFGADRVVNFNQSSPAAHRQHGVLMVQGSADGGNAAQTEYVPGAPLEGRSPKHVARIVVSSTLGTAFHTIRRDGELHTTDPFSASVAHELGHAVNIRHHGEGDLKQQPWTFVPQPGGNFWLKEGNVAIKVMSEQNQPVAIRPTAAGMTQFTVYLGVQGGQHSGNDQCFMRYGSAQAYKSTAQNNVRYWVSRTEGMGMDLCDSSAGTGVNGNRSPQPRYGNATKGKCKSQIRVTDR